MWQCSCTAAQTIAATCHAAAALRRMIAGGLANGVGWHMSAQPKDAAQGKCCAARSLSPPESAYACVSAASVGIHFLALAKAPGCEVARGGVLAPARPSAAFASAPDSGVCISAWTASNASGRAHCDGFARVQLSGVHISARKMSKGGERHTALLSHLCAAATH